MPKCKGKSCNPNVTVPPTFFQGGSQRGSNAPANQPQMSPWGGYFNKKPTDPARLDQIILETTRKNPARPNEDPIAYKERIKALLPGLTDDDLRGWVQRNPPTTNQPARNPSPVRPPSPQPAPAPIAPGTSGSGKPIMVSQETQQQPLGISPRQQVINDLVRRIPRNVMDGEETDQYADRLRPGPRAAFRQLFGLDDPNPTINAWGNLTDRQAITPEEIAIAEQQPEVAQRLAQQQQERLNALQKDRAEREALLQQQQRENQPAELQNQNIPYGKQEMGTPTPPSSPPRSRASSFSSQTSMESSSGGRGGMESAPAPQPGGVNVSARARQRQEFLLERMNALLGQIQRTGRRATKTELDDIQDLYSQLGQIPQDLQPQLERIERQFNRQALVRNEPRLGELSQQQQAVQSFLQSIGGHPDVPMQGRRIDYQTIATQFPQFFKRQNNGQFVVDGDGNPILATEDIARQNIKKDFRNSAQRQEQENLYKKVRSDINYVLAQQNDPNLQGIGSRRATRGVNMQQFLQEDRQYRASDAYRNTQLPNGIVRDTIQQRIAQETGIPQASSTNADEFFFPVTNQPLQQQAPQTTPPVTAPQQTTMQGEINPRLNAYATNPQGIPTAMGEGIYREGVGRQYGRVGQLFMGNNAQILQVPQLQPWQRDILREMGTMGIESLRQAYQPLETQEAQSVEANNAIVRILDRLQNNDPIGAQQELTLAGGLGNIQALARNEGIPIQQTAQMAQMGQVAQPGAQGFVAPGMQQAQPQAAVGGLVNPGQQNVPIPGGLGELLNAPARIRAAWNQSGGDQGGFFNILRRMVAAGGQAAQEANAFLNTAQQAAALPGQVRMGFQQGGVPQALNNAQAGIGNLNNPQPGVGATINPAINPMMNQFGHLLPITAQQEVNRFYGQTVPTLAERFTAAGGGAQRSSAFRGALGAAGRDLSMGLAALNEQQQLAQQQQAFNQQMAQREFNENQRRFAQQQQQANQLFAFNRGASMLNSALQPLNSMVYQPAGQGIAPMLLNSIAGATTGGVQAASLFR